MQRCHVLHDVMQAQVVVAEAGRAGPAASPAVYDRVTRTLSQSSSPHSPPLVRGASENNGHVKARDQASM